MITNEKKSILWTRRLQNLKRRQETKNKKINRKKFQGVRSHITKYRNDIFNTFHDKQLLKSHLNQFSNQSYEGISDVFKSYVSEVSRRMNDLLEKSREHLKASFEKGTEKVMDKDGDKVPAEDVESEGEVDLLVNQQKGYYKNLTELQSRAIDRIVKKGTQQDKSYEEIADNIINTNERITKNKATSIARSEIVKSNNLGQVKTLKNAGAENYNFIHSGDKKVCPICRNYQGAKGREKIYKVENAGTSQHPLPVISTHPNCRCVIVYHS